MALAWLLPPTKSRSWQPGFAGRTEQDLCLLPCSSAGILRCCGAGEPPSSPQHPQHVAAVSGALGAAMLGVQAEGVRPRVLSAQCLRIAGGAEGWEDAAVGAAGDAKAKGSFSSSIPERP